LQSEFVDFAYTGIDHSSEQIRLAQKRNQNNSKVKFRKASSEINERYDYVVASGIFNLIFAPHDEWMAHVKKEMRNMFNLCNKMFACNFLSSYADAERKVLTLFYPKPEEIFTFAAQELSSKLVLVHDYGLHDFTLIVKK
jgi:cyclopropane fatty-acyl-phospholipid synthase-like methyltransferase